MAIFMWATAGRIRTITPEQLHTLSANDIGALWKEYVQAFRGILSEADNGEVKKQAQLEQLLDEVTLLLVSLNLANPKAFSTFRTLDVENGGVLEKGLDFDRIRGMVKTCKFPLEQRRRISAARR